MKKKEKKNWNVVPMYYTMQQIHEGKKRSRGILAKRNCKNRKKKKKISGDKCYHVLRLYCCSW